MTVQVNVKFPDKFYNYISEVSKQEGFVSVQEFVRDAVRKSVREDLSGAEIENIEKIYLKSEKNKSWKGKKELLEALGK